MESYPANDAVPLSFPSVLRNPGIADRYAHLRESKPNTETTSNQNTTRKSKRDDNEGRRWVRRRENALFAHNPHVVRATKKDYTIQMKPLKTTFPEPLPPYLPRISKLPATSVPVRDIGSANAGRFSLSLKGMRRDLRRSGFRAEILVKDLEVEILDWLDAGGTVMAPDLVESVDLSSGRVIGDTGTVSEVSRTPLQLIWRITDDAFARYVVHCCARFHNVVSFSREVSGLRLTYLLRPNVTRPDHYAVTMLDTPPVTDLDDSSRNGSDSDLASSISEPKESDFEAHSVPNLSTISEGPSSVSPDMNHSQDLDLDAWSVIGDSDADGDESENDNGLSAAVASLSINSESADAPLETASRVRVIPFRNRLWDKRARSNSSPSRSPARRSLRRLQRVRDPLSAKEVPSKTLYGFLYT